MPCYFGVIVVVAAAAMLPLRASVAGCGLLLVAADCFSCIGFAAF